MRARIMQVLAEVAVKQKDHQQIIKTHQWLKNNGYDDKEALLFNLGTALGLMGDHQKADDIFKQLLITIFLTPARRFRQKKSKI